MCCCFVTKRGNEGFGLMDYPKFILSTQSTFYAMIFGAVMLTGTKSVGRSAKRTLHADDMESRHSMG